MSAQHLTTYCHNASIMERFYVRIRPFADAKAGVAVQPGAQEDDAVVYYNGLLARSGAEQVYIHCGLGTNSSWTYLTYLPMARTPSGYKVNLSVPENECHFCFKDSAGNWDNNNGANWSIVKQKRAGSSSEHVV